MLISYDRELVPVNLPAERRSWLEVFELFDERE
jgi:hypothetical protein